MLNKVSVVFTKFQKSQRNSLGSIRKNKWA